MKTINTKACGINIHLTINLITFTYTNFVHDC